MNGRQMVRRRPDRREEHAHRLAFIMDGRRRGLSYRAIGEQCNPPISAPRVYALYKKALAEIPAASIAELRTEHRERLEALLSRFEQVADTFFPLVQNGRVILDDRDGHPVRDIRPNMEALKAVQGVDESLRKLLGVDAPAKTQVEAAHTVTYKIEFE